MVDSYSAQNNSQSSERPHNYLTLHSTDLLTVLNISMETGSNSKVDSYQKFKAGYIIKSINNTYTVLRNLSKNAVLCSDTDGYVYVIKFDKTSNLSFYKETRLNILLNKGYIKINSNNFNNSNNSNNLSANPEILVNQNKTKWSFRKLFSCICYPGPDLDSYHIKTYDTNKLIYKTSDQNTISNPTYLTLDNDVFDPNMVPDVVETFRNENNGYQVSRFCGIDLYTYISIRAKDKKIINESLCKKIFYQIIQIIYKLHKLGIAHGDLSLENFCIDSRFGSDNYSDISRIKLIDFGFAGIHPLSQIIHIYDDCKYDKDLYNQSDRFNICENKSLKTLYCSLVPYNSHYGKLYYVSPERSNANKYLGEKYCMFKDDIYSLGMILFMLISGTAPYKNTDKEIIPHHTVPYEEWLKTFVSAECINLLRKIICYEKSRISIDELISHPWLK
jgi:hypothetical protein